MASLSPMKLKLQSKSYSTIGFHKESGSMMLDSMFQSQAKSVVLYKDKLIDDIDAAEWLKDVGFPQYTETFIANLSYDGRIILRSRLSTVRLQDLSKMNIINFEHQKQLMNHINYILKNPFSTILRQRQLQQQLKEEEESVKVGLSPAPSPAKTAPPSIAKPNSIQASAKAYPDEKKESSSSKNVAPAKELPPPLQTAQTSFRENKESNTARSRRNSRSGMAEGSLLSAESKSESFDAKEVKEGSGGGAVVGLAKPVLTAQEKAAKRKEAEKRRRSFDSQIWNSISSLRNKQSDIANAAENLRSGIAQAQASFSYSAESRDPGEVGVNPTSAATPLPSDKGGKRHRRRWSFGSPDGTSEDNFSNNHQKAQAYGNMALEYDMMITSLKALQSEILFKFRKIINCEKASIFFINDLTRELVLFADDGKWYRLPSGSGIAGYCVETGETVNIPDAYADDRFNKNIDLKTGFRTRNILAKPVRRNRGGGNIVAVIEMMNKADGADFASEDEDILGACVENVADLLSSRFQELVNAGERFSGSATFIMGRNASVGGLSGGSSLVVEIEDEGKADDPGPGKVRFKE